MAVMKTTLSLDSEAFFPISYTGKNELIDAASHNISAAQKTGRSSLPK